jgi:signal transduction histidine kinase
MFLKAIEDKLLLLLCGCILMMTQSLTVYSVVSLLVCITVSALAGVYTERKYVYTLATIYTFLCIYRTEFTGFLPLVLYDVFVCGISVYTAAVMLPLAAASLLVSGISINTAFILVFILLSYFLYRRAVMLERIRNELVRQRDSGKETAMLLESKNMELMEKQDVEIRLATLAERNRIAREIHDNVGHMLSRSILQVGAMITVNKDAAAGESLNRLKDTLSHAMDSIRQSVHDLHNESIDLNVQVKALIRDFSFCPVQLDYDIDGMMDSGLKYALLSIIREALSNIARHSDATRASITLREHPGFYQLIIQDNGQGATQTRGGMGLNSMSERVTSFDGNIHIDSRNGFKIFISIPKKQPLSERSDS